MLVMRIEAHFDLGEKAGSEIDQREKQIIGYSLFGKIGKIGKSLVIISYYIITYSVPSAVEMPSSKHEKENTRVLLHVVRVIAQPAEANGSYNNGSRGRGLSPLESSHLQQNSNCVPVENAFFLLFSFVGNRQWRPSFSIRSIQCALGELLMVKIVLVSDAEIALSTETLGVPLCVCPRRRNTTKKKAKKKKKKT